MSSITALSLSLSLALRADAPARSLSFALPPRYAVVAEEAEEGTAGQAVLRDSQKGKGRAKRKIEFITDQEEAACSAAEASQRSIVEGFIVKPTRASSARKAPRGTAENPATIGYRPLLFY